MGHQWCVDTLQMTGETGLTAKVALVLGNG
jgi:hypothetical protein